MEKRGGASLNRFLRAMTPAPALRSQPIVRVDGVAPGEAGDDLLAVEEPLEIRVGGRGVAVVMRTPGHDRELVAGFLVTEGIVRSRDDLLDLVRCRAELGSYPETKSKHYVEGAALSAPLVPDGGDGVPPSNRKGSRTAFGPGPGSILSGAADANRIDVLLAPGSTIDLDRLTRHVFTSSSCGICSRASIEAVRGTFRPLAAPLSPRREVLAELPGRLRAVQAAFAATGGLHASALFDAEGRLQVVREDVGRHNALDKVIGHAFLAEQLPLAGRILLVSGRVSFEIMQKALAAGIPCVAAISAPTSSAVEFARESGQTLVGFLRPSARGGSRSDAGGRIEPAAMRMNVYAGNLAE